MLWDLITNEVHYFFIYNYIPSDIHWMDLVSLYEKSAFAKYIKRNSKLCKIRCEYWVSYCLWFLNILMEVKWNNLYCLWFSVCVWQSGRASSGKSSRSRKASAKSVRSQVSENETQQDKEGETKEGEQDGMIYILFPQLIIYRIILESTSVLLI